MRFLIAISVVVMFMLSGAVRAAAEEWTLPDRFGLRLGGYQIENADTIIRLDPSNLPVGASIDFHDTLNGDTSTTVFRADGFYRFNDRHALGYAWYDVKFNGSGVLNKEITWGDKIFPVNSQVDSELRFNVYKLNYQYSLFHNEEAELGASIGLHIMHISTSISVSGMGGSRKESRTAWLPVLGLFANYNFTPRLSAYYSYQVFFINYEDKVKGGLQDFLLGLEYRLFRHIALGAAYNRFGLNMQAERDTATLSVNTNWNGGLLYGAVYF